MNRRFFRNALKIKTLAFPKQAISQTFRVLVQQCGQIFIKKVTAKRLKSAVFRIFAPKWRFHTYKTVISLHSERDLIDKECNQLVVWEI